MGKVAKGSTGDEAVPSAWQCSADRLAAWAEAHLVNRRDVFGHYIEASRRNPDGSTAFTDKAGLTTETLTRHFRGESTGDLIGLHSTGIDESGACTSRWLAIDVDRHDEGTDAEATRRFAFGVHRVATDLGFEPLLLDSNGDGGFHVLILFDGPTPTGDVFHFGKWLSTGWAGRGLTKEPEVFPKQAILKGGKSFGNWLRLPGRHHTRAHWSKAWDGKRWQEGDEAVALILDATGSPASLIPPVIADESGPAPATTPPGKIARAGTPIESYVRAAKDREFGRVISAANGTRNDTLNSAAFALGQLVGAGALDRGSVEADLLAVAERAGLGRDESIRTIASGLEAGLLKPRDLTGVGPKSRPVPEPRHDEERGEPPEWEPLCSRELLPVPTFPVEVYPPRIAAFLIEAARVVQAPTDYFAVAALAMLATVIGMSVNIRIKSSWHEAPNLFIALVAPPGSKKSPALRILARALYRIDRELRERYEAELLDYESKLESTKKGDPKPKPPVSRHLTLDDVTREAVAQIHHDSIRGLGILLDELTAWFRSFDVYRAGKGSDRQFWMSLNTGARVKVNRKGSQAPVIVARPCVTVFGPITPATLSGLAGSDDDGWADRMLFAFPDRFAGSVAWHDEEITQEAMSDWEVVIDRLWDRKMTVDEKDGRERPWFVGFTEGGRAAWRTWVNRHRAEQEALHDDDPALVGPWSKFEGFMARVILILSQTRQAESEWHDSNPWNASEADVEAAGKVIDYFKAHLRRVRGFVGPKRSEIPRGADVILRWLRRTEVAAFSAEDVNQALGKTIDLEERAEAYTWLQRHGFIRAMPREDIPGKKGRKPAPRYEVNPNLFSPTFPTNPTEMGERRGDDHEEDQF